MTRVITATIRNGHAVADELATLPEGTIVEVATLDDDGELSAEDLDELDRANQEADRGEFISADELLQRLDARRVPRAS